jgi:hypothetical protein
VQRGEFNALVEHRTLLGRQKFFQRPAVPFAAPLRDDRLSQVLADDFLLESSQDSFGFRIPAHNFAAFIKCNDSIQRGGQDWPDAFFARATHSPSARLEALALKIPAISSKAPNCCNSPEPLVIPVRALRSPSATR